MQKEIEYAQTEVKKLEDQVLERMVEGDDLAAAVKRAEAALAAEQKTVDADRKALGAEVAEQKAVARAAESRTRDRCLLASIRRCSRLFEPSRDAETAWPWPKPGTASAPSATCGSDRRCSTPSSAATRSSSATTATGSCSPTPARESRRRCRRVASPAI